MLTSPAVPEQLLAAAAPAELSLHLLVVAAAPDISDVASELASFAQLSISAVASLAEARRSLAQNPPDIVLLDVALPENGALKLLDHITGTYPRTDVVVITGASTVAAAMEAMRSGAADYLTTPATNSSLRALLDRARQRLERDIESRSLRERLRTPTGMGPLIGTSAGMEKLYRILSKVALSQHPVLIVGESGTGKELVAHTVHSVGPKAGPFLRIDCAAASPAEIESELFGRIKGASSTTARAKPGALVAAAGGVVLLDEVGELPLEVQAKLVRALLEKQVRPIGAAQPVPFSSRVIAASSRDLIAAVEQGQFRKDLYFRLTVVKLAIPPLRDRREDIPMLAQHFLQNAQRQPGLPLRFSDACLRLLCNYDWPGNVRELQSAIERTCAMSSGPVLHTVDLPTQLQDFQAHLRVGTGFTHLADDYHEAPRGIVPIADMEKHAILSTIQQLNGDKLMAARLLGIGKTTLYRKLKEYGADA